MRMSVTYRQEGSLGIFELAGTKTFEEAKQTWGRIGAAAAADHLRGILIYDRATSELKAYEVIELVQWLGESGFPRTLRVAIIDPRAATQSNNPFGETVARNRSFPFIVVFPDDGAAGRWLAANAAQESA